MRKILVILMFMISTNMNLLADSIRNCHIDSMLIHYVDFDIMTLVDIGCENFESSIGNYESVMLRDSIHIYQFKEMLLTDKKEVSQSIDVRCKVYMYTSQGIKIVCLGKHVLQYKGNLYGINASFVRRMEDIISKGEEIVSDTIIDNTPILLVKLDTFCDSIRQKCLPIMEKEGVNFLKIVIDFYIDRKGNAVDVIVKEKGNQIIPDSVQYEIVHLVQEHLKWSSSRDRSPKVRKVLPFTLYFD